MIIVNYLHDLSRNYYADKTKILNLDGKESILNIFKEILNSKLVLISYDCDFNFEPCNKNGNKAHWALITGFLLPIRLKKDDDLLNSISNKELLINLNNTEINTECQLSEMVNFEDENYVICRHGKSKHSAIWSLSRLLESNRQLKYIDDEKCNQNDFVRPFDGDISNSLSSKALIFN